MKNLKTTLALIRLKRLRFDLPAGAFQKLLDSGKHQYILLQRLLDVDVDGVLKKEIAKLAW